MVRKTLNPQPLPGRKTDYSVIIPAYNEESLLPATLARLRNAMRFSSLQGEIIVVDNNSSDRTAEIAAKSGARVVYEPFRQIARARNTGALASQNRFLIFLDADTLLEPQLLKQALLLLERGTTCGGGALIDFDSELPFFAKRLVRLWNWLSWKKKLAAGSFIFCLTEGFNEIGGFDPGLFAGEEIILSRRLKRWGQQQKLDFVILKEHPVVTSGRKFHWHSSLQIGFLLLLFTIFPFALRSRKLCGFWYDRPEKS
jgi:glycosyltransferase involved in cell wall biosynthesis